MKVLLVDDSKTVISIYSKLLEENGYEVVSASNANDAYEVAIAESPQIAIIDYFMEDRNGDQLIRQLQRDPRTKEMVCAIFSQHPDVVDKALASGAIDLISKEDSNEIFLLRVNAMRRLVVIWSRQREIAQLVISESQKKETFRILFVDDSPTVREVYYNLLTHQGYEVILAEDKASARHQAKQLKPQLAILDYYLPDGTGAELARELRATPEMEDILIWLYTSRTDLKEMQDSDVDVLYKEDPDDILVHRLDSIKRYVMAEHSKRLIEAKVEQHQEELQQSTELLEHVERERGYFLNLLNTLPLALISIKKDLITYSNRSFRNEFGIDPKEMSITQLERKLSINQQLSNVCNKHNSDPSTIKIGHNFYRLSRTGSFTIKGEREEVLLSLENISQEDHIYNLQQQAYLAGITESNETIFKESGSSILMLTADNKNFELRYDQIGSALEEILTMTHASVQQVTELLQDKHKVPVVLREMELAIENLYQGTNKVRNTLRAQQEVIESSEDHSYQLPEYSFDSLIYDATQTLQQTLQQHQIQVSSRHDGKMESLRFPKTMLARIIRYMVHHAIYSILSDDKLCFGGGEISISIKASHDNPNQAQITVIDNGPEHDQQQLSALHDMQLHATQKTDDGHELFLVTGLAQNYGGRLMIHSNLSGNGYQSQLSIPRSLHLHKRPG